MAERGTTKPSPNAFDGPSVDRRAARRTGFNTVYEFKHFAPMADWQTWAHKGRSWRSGSLSLVLGAVRRVKGHCGTPLRSVSLFA
jgi:hypothetical protein